MEIKMADPQVVSRDDWLTARQKLLVHEKELTRHPGPGKHRTPQNADGRNRQGVRL
jgi:hypothetical protein